LHRPEKGSAGTSQSHEPEEPRNRLTPTADILSSEKLGLCRRSELGQNLAAMARSDPLRYTETEIRSFLPTGWSLAGDPTGSWDPKKRVWRATVLDNVDFDWPVVVDPADAASLGRLEALRRAMDRVYRERLG
jgi:hypothetical protein